jgi:mono/diheme cytochrome c family protein
MRGFILGVIITVLVLIGGVFATVHFGWFPVGADNPPGAMEKKLANMAMDEYVDHHAPNQQNPIQPTDDNLADGARIYEQNCALCHGGASNKVSPMRSKFSPPVPQIINRIPHDDDAHLWWVTKHGIRMTGMPAWDGVLTDDDMWKVIAFVKHSNSLSPQVQEAWHMMAREGQTSQQGATATPATPQPGNPAPAARPGRR